MAAATAFLAAGAGISLYSAYQQSEAAKAQADFQAAQYRMNARLSEMQSKDALERGDKAAAEHGKQVRGLVGSQRASLAAQGIDIASGSALEIQDQTRAIGAEDQMTIRNNAWREAWGYRVQAADLSDRARFAGEAGETTRRNTLLTGGLQAINYGAQAYGGRGKTKTDNYDGDGWGFSV